VVLVLFTVLKCFVTRKVLIHWFQKKKLLDIRMKTASEVIGSTLRVRDEEMNEEASIRRLQTLEYSAV